MRASRSDRRWSPWSQYRSRLRRTFCLVLGCLLPVLMAFTVSAQRTTSVPMTGMAGHAAPASGAAPRDIPHDAVSQGRAIGHGHSTEEVFSGLMARAEASGSVRVIVGVRTAFLPEGALRAQADVQVQRAAIQQAQENLLLGMSAFGASAVKKFEYIPFLAMEVDAIGLQYLHASPDVTAIEEDALNHTSLAESVPLIGAPAAWANGFAGAGQVVAILDTGVDKTHPFLSGKVVSEACYSTTSGSTTSSVCPGGVAQSTDVGSGVNCSVPGCEHGTHVAGIAAGKSASFAGVARDANIIAVQVFSRITGCTSSVDCVAAFNSDILLGLQQVQQLSGTFKIAAVNLSLGGFGSAINCDTTQTAYKAAIDNLRSIGIATVVASGNDGNPGGVTSPGCVSSAISVGSTGDGSSNGSSTSTVDAVSSFSNCASFLGLLAPGEWITSSVPGGTFATFRGTSQATPHVTGAWAVLKSKTPAASVSQVFQALTSTGLSINDPRNQIAKPRIRVDAAVAALSGTACSYALAPSTQAVGQGGGSGTVTVTAGSGCAWTARSDVPWLTITSGNSGSGNGSVGYAAAANTSLDRAGTLSIAGQLFIVTQPGAPVLAVDDGSFENASGLAAGGLSYRVNRLTPASYPMTINAVAIYFRSGDGVRAGDSLTILAGINPTGSAIIDGIHFQTTPATVQALDQFNVYPIQGVAISSGDFVVGMKISHVAGAFPFAIDTTPPSRRRSYRSIDGTTFSLIDDIGTVGNYGIRAVVSQTLACPTITDLNPPSVISGFTGPVTIAITGTGFTGVTAVKFTNNLTAQFTVNSDTGISATLPSNTVTGAISISKVNCADAPTAVFSVTPCISIAPTSQVFNGQGGTGSINVTAVATRPSCSWTASSNVSWITISSGSSGIGNGTVNYTVGANATGSGRSGTLAISGQAFSLLVSVVQGSSSAFSATGGLATGRYNHVATLLRNGKVLITGGDSSTGVLASAELYDPVSGTFSATGSLATARSGHTATLLPNGKVLIAGGYKNSPAASFASAELYDPASGTFSATGSLITARDTHTATLLQNGKVLITGGGQYPLPGFLASAELYDPAAGTFSATGSLATARVLHTATLLQNGKVLISAGAASSGSGLALVELYDPAAGTFAATGHLATGRIDHAATLLQNGKVIITGGFDAVTDFSSVELYDPAAGTFAATGSLATARDSHTATLLPNGKVLIIGGGGVSSDSLTSAELYDPAAGSFSAGGNLGTPRTIHTATLLPNGKVLITGGSSYPGNIYLASAELYDVPDGGKRRAVSH